jgi:hypothetical protein
LVLAAGRTAYQRAAAKSSIGDEVYRTALGIRGEGPASSRAL